MWVSKIQKQYIEKSTKRFCQGDILSDIRFMIVDSQAQPDSQKIFLLRYGVIMSQDCDLEQDYPTEDTPPINQDKSLPTILICPAYPAEQFYKGEHIEGWLMEKQSSKLIEKIQKNNELNRYHFLIKDDNFIFPDLVIDFKHFYTIPISILNNQQGLKYIATINELFRERLSQRFANYLSRFGLPTITRD